jgi:hypothetical protein
MEEDMIHAVEVQMEGLEGLGLNEGFVVSVEVLVVEEQELEHLDHLRQT